MNATTTNRLRALAKQAGYTMRDLAADANIPESTLRRWAAGYVIPRKERAVLARLIGCETTDLVPCSVARREQQALSLASADVAAVHARIVTLRTIWQAVEFS